jgi:hypothetical protein
MPYRDDIAIRYPPISSNVTVPQIVIESAGAVSSSNVHRFPGLIVGRVSGV